MSCFENLQIEVFGESHSTEIGARITGIPAGVFVDQKELALFMERRKAGKGEFSTTRIEQDLPLFSAGLTGNYTDGTQLVFTIKNTDVIKSSYQDLRETPRPSHADYVSYFKSEDKVIPSGGGRFSGRMTAPLCVAGYIAKSYLSSFKISVLAYVSQIGNIKSTSYLEQVIDSKDILNAHDQVIPLLNNRNLDEINELIKRMRKEQDSVGGVIECIVYGMPIGVGDALFMSLEGRIACSIYAVPGIKGVEFGAGFMLSKMTGSEANDQFTIKDNIITMSSNNSGGINGGVSNGMPITLRVGVRPTPSIGKKQMSVNLRTRECMEIAIQGRHDVCIVPRVVPCIESAVALSIMDMLI